MPPPTGGSTSNAVCDRVDAQCRQSPSRSIDQAFNPYIPSYVVISSPSQPQGFLQPSHYVEKSLPPTRLSSSMLAPVPPNRSISPPLPSPTDQRLSRPNMAPSSPSMERNRAFYSNSAQGKKKQRLSESELRMNRWDSSGSRSSLYGSSRQGSFASRDFTPTLPGQKRHLEVSEMKNSSWNDNESRASTTLRRGDERLFSNLSVRPEAAAVRNQSNTQISQIEPDCGDFGHNNAAS